MNKYITFILILLTPSMMSNAQVQYKEKPEPINISTTLSYDQFQAIKQFVLDKGQTQTYCNMYNDNPYCEFDGATEVVDLYLNPIVQLTPEGQLKDIDSYNVIFLRTRNNDNTNIYGNPKTKEVYLTSYWDTEKSLKDKADRIKADIKNILKTIEEDNTHR